MATIRYKIFKHHKKNDGTYNVKYCLTHKGKQLYHSSAHFVTDKDIRKDLTIRNADVLDAVNDDIKQLRKRISEIGLDVAGMEARQLLDAITKSSEPADDIDFVKFSRNHINQLMQAGRDGYAANLAGTLNSFIDFFDSETIAVRAITSAVLRDFERYIRSDRKIKRMGGQGKMIAKRIKGSDSTGVSNTMGKLRVLFNACRAAHNTETNALIPNNPFEFYKIPRAGMARKRGGDLVADDVMSIRDYSVDPGSLEELGRDMFMLSFYLCGMNAKDIYLYDGPRQGRVEYERSKTRDRRADAAFISVSIPDEARAILERYSLKMLHRRYTKYPYFIAAINSGLDKISRQLFEGRKITFYHARHTFASLAYNRCGFSKDWIGQALNHSDKSALMTERYIAADWSVVDKVQAGVLGLLPTKQLV